MTETELRAAELSDTDRAVAFSDGVFAIVITLLVLELRVPQVPPGQLLSGLLDEWPAYVAYVASYLYVALMIFLALPIFYGVTDHGLYELSVVVRRRPRQGVTC